MSDQVIYKSNQIIGFNKPSGWPVQEDKTKDRSFLSAAQSYCNKKLHLIHRIDRPASGVVLFAKTEKALKSINRQLQERSVGKTYLAIIQKSEIPSEGQLIHYLKKNGKINKSFTSETPTESAKEAIMQYRVVSDSNNYLLLQIALISGRHHQIRAQLAAIGCPIKGDTKYGFRRANKDRSINLHAWKLEIRHPISKETVLMEAPIPQNDIWGIFEF